MFMVRASAEGTILTIGPAATALKPWICKTDSKIRYMSETGIRVGAITVTFPRTLGSTIKFLPVNSLTNWIKTLMSTSFKLSVTNLSDAGAPGLSSAANTGRTTDGVKSRQSSSK